jgi:hypothetical protein
MARIRSVKPEFWVDRSFVRKVPNRDARMLYMALWNLADEHARLMGDPAYIKGQAFPYAEDDDLTPKVIDALLDMLVIAGRVVRYEVDGDPYLFLPRLAKHQRLEAAKVPSRLPPPPDPDDPAPRPDKSARDADEDAPDADSSAHETNVQASAPPESRADKSARRADESASGADKSSLLYVAGSRLQVACAAAPEPGAPAQLVLVPDLAADEPPQHAEPETEGQRINRLAKVYTDLVPLSTFLAVQGVVRKAVRSTEPGTRQPLYDDEQITDGLRALAKEKRALTANTLRVAIEGFGRSSGHSPYQNPADQSVYFGAIS